MIKKAGALTLDELLALYRRLLKHSSQLEGALGVEASDKLRDFTARQIMKHKWTQDEKDYLRWKLVREWLDRKGWDGHQYAYATEKLKSHPAAANPGTMKAAYDRMQRILPVTQQRPRSYTRRRTFH
jgi:hypothetical protein